MADTNWKLRGAADFDQDGMSDLFWQNTATGHLSVWLMNGATVRTMLAPTPGLMADHAWRIVAPR